MVHLLNSPQNINDKTCYYSFVSNCRGLYKMHQRESYQVFIKQGGGCFQVISIYFEELYSDTA